MTGRRGGDGAEDGAQPGSVPPAVVSCRGLSKRYGTRRAVDRLSLEVRAGEAYGLIGPNGAGKTTTIKMVCGLVAPDDGEVCITDPRFAPASPGGGRGRGPREILGYVPQEVALLPTLTVAENLRFWARMYGIRRAERRSRLEEALAVVGLTDAAKERVDRCSGGMQRRLNLGVALLHRPRLLVLDEPTVGVDTQSRAALLATLGELRDGGTAIVYTSHYLDEVQRLCDRVGVIDHGRLLAEGTPADLVAGNSKIADLESLFLELTGRELRD